MENNYKSDSSSLIDQINNISNVKFRKTKYEKNNNISNQYNSKNNNENQYEISYDGQLSLLNDIEMNNEKIFTDDEPSYFVACFDPQTREFFFSEFIREKFVIKDNVLNKILDERLNIVQPKIEREWELIKKLSKFEKNYFISQKSKQYLSRPISSSYLFPEQLELNNFTSTSPLPTTFQQYGMVNLNIIIHDSICEGIPASDRLFTKKVGFYYVVDTIIKDCLRYLISKFNCYSGTTGYENLITKLNEDIKNRKNKYVLKFKSLESYLYGDYPICTYELIRLKVREYESIDLILMKFPIGDVEVQPDITHFPPIIYIPPKFEFSYNSLLENYLNLYVTDTRQPIIYRFKPNIEQQDLYFKKYFARKEKLLKYNESGECDYPFYIKVKGLKNLFALKNQIDSNNYNKFKTDFPYFNEIPSMRSIKNKKNLLQLIAEKICSKCDKNKKAEKEEINEEKEHKKIRKKILESYEQSLDIQHDLNYLKDTEKTETYEKKMNFITNELSYSTTLLDRLNKLSTEKKKPEKSKKKDKYVENFILKNFKLPHSPTFIKIEVFLMYGSYEILKLTTRFLLLNNNININEKLNFKNQLISHLPRETRIAVNIVGYDKYQQNAFELGSCSTGIYDDNGIMEQGVIPLYIWPLYKIDPRVVCCFPYKGKYHHEKNLKDNIKFDEHNYCILYIEMPKFVRPVAYTIKTPQSYREYLKLKYPNENIYSTYEIKILYSNSMEQLEEILDNLKNSDQYFLNLEKKKQLKNNEKSKINNSNQTSSKKVANKKDSNSKDKEIKEEEEALKEEERNIWNVLEYCLPLVRDTIHKDPLTPLTKEEREYVIYCRDYLCTIPSALQIFLRCINWLNPLQVNIARNYIKKWAKIDPEDAVCLLDPRYPDSFVREYAISILKEMTDDLTSLFMLQLCQSLIYEIGLVNPLSNFLTQKSIMNPKLIGSSFFWNYYVNQNNRLFHERLTIYTTQILMISGSNFINETNKSYMANKILKKVCGQVKENFQRKSKDIKEAEAKKHTLDLLKKLLKDNSQFLTNFTYPIHPCLRSVELDYDQLRLFYSKMVPCCMASRSSDGSTFKIIFKIGDDLRQDMLTLQILNIMDKMWLDSDLDLKIVAYRVGPTGLREGLIEFVGAQNIDGLQIDEGVGGALDRELLIKHLRSKGQPSNKTAIYEPAKQYDNFVKSLAGFCVATCVLGIADRHLGNVMIKDNGIFFHIDYGHFLGNFKYKFGIKRERAPFLLLPEMAHVYTKTGKEQQFKSICEKAYNILRKNANRLMNMFIIMSSTGLPELSGMSDVIYLKDMLRLDKKNEEDAGNHFIGLINQSKNEKFRLLDNMIHNMKHG